MSKITMGDQVFVYPMPVVLLGTMLDKRPNFMTVGWISRVNYKPPLLGVGIGKSHASCDGILEKGYFSINYPNEDMIGSTDYCGIFSGRDVDKSGIFRLFFGETGAPMVYESSLSVECNLERTIDLGSNYLFLGSVVQSYTEGIYLTEGKLDIRKMLPLLLTMPDNSYWSVGEKLGDAWKIGTGYSKEEKQ